MRISRQELFYKSNPFSGKVNESVDAIDIEALVITKISVSLWLHYFSVFSISRKNNLFSFILEPYFYI